MIELAKDHMTRGSTNEAICLLSHVLEERRGLNGDDDPRTLSAMGLIVSLLHELGRLDQAVVLAREWSVRCRRVFGICHPDTLIASGFTVSLLSELGCDEEAEPIARETHAAATLYHGEDHPDTLVALSHLGVVLRSQGKLAEAEEAMRLEVSRSTQALGTAHPDTLTAQSNLAYTLVTQVQPALHQMEQGSKSLNKARLLADPLPLLSFAKLAEAEELFSQQLDQCITAHSETHPLTRVALYNLVRTVREFPPTKKFAAKAESLLRRQIELCVRTVGAGAEETRAAKADLAAHLEATETGRFDEMVELLTEAHGEAHPRTLVVLEGEMCRLHDQGRPADAEPIARQLLSLSTKIWGEGHTQTVRYSWMLAALLRQQGRTHEAACITGDWGFVDDDIKNEVQERQPENAYCQYWIDAVAGSPA
eukprot:scaffold99490_cov35-Tisochrysis_lutea.AAC.1